MRLRGLGSRFATGLTIIPPAIAALLALKGAQKPT